MKFNSSTILSLYFLLLAALSCVSYNTLHRSYLLLTLFLALFFFLKEIRLLHRNTFIKTFLRCCDFLGFLVQYQLMGVFTTYFRPFCDEKLVKIEEKIFGLQPLILFDKISNNFFTEFLMLCYFLYVPLLPLIFLYLVLKNVKNADEYVMRLAVTYSITFLLFFIFPVACPKNFLNFESFKPLKGLLLGNIIISSWEKYDIKGGCFPSPHCAAGFTILYFLYKNKLKIFYPVFIIMIGMFISTVYGRFHYLSDSLTGIFLSYLINRIMDKIIKIKPSSAHSCDKG